MSLFFFCKGETINLYMFFPIVYREMAKVL